jgi:hypothetical protein
VRYRIELEDDVVQEIVRFSPGRRAAWNICLSEIEQDPWPRVGDGFVVEALTGDDFFTDYIFTARWFPAAILYFARDYGPDDPLEVDLKGELRVYRLVW